MRFRSHPQPGGTPRRAGATLAHCCLSLLLASVAMPGRAAPLEHGTDASGRARIEDGLRATLDMARGQKTEPYPLWPVGGREIPFAVIDDGRDFYLGLTVANLSAFADASGTRFTLGKAPRLLAVFVDQAASWDDVQRFIGTQNPALALPEEMTRVPFTGCNVLKRFANGEVVQGVLVVDVGGGHSLDQVQGCAYRSLSMLFGFESRDERQALFDLTVLRDLYALVPMERPMDGILDALARKHMADGP